MPPPTPDGFPLPSKLTVTEISGGGSFTMVPDHCVVGMDIRLTDVVDDDTAAKLIDHAITLLDSSFPAPRPTTMDVVVSWPPFLLGRDDQPAAALTAGARAAGLDVGPKVAGPSNIGNFLAAEGIPATAGFGFEFSRSPLCR
ncbi:peptidase dimerization domain-containing protein [Nocardia pseudovaccinii]|uniref:peptidase dimerization domain-containing protein n=1 Tax=Nocardia pseudovaccinii TaxID=189540 RepID=UPI0007A4E27E